MSGSRPNWTVDRERGRRIYLYRPGGIFTRGWVRVEGPFFRGEVPPRTAWFAKLIEAQVACELWWTHDPAGDAWWNQRESAGIPEGHQA